MTKTKLAAVSGDTNAAVLSERMRVSAILESPEGRRNPAMAQRLALYSPLAVEIAKSILAEAPSANPYLDAMALQGPLNLGDGTGSTIASFNTAESAKAARLAEIRAGAKIFNESRGYGKAAKRGD